MEEMLDYVDETDQIIGQATRGDVHRRKLMHRSTHIIVANSSGQFFVQLRSMSKDNNPGLWDTSAAGHVDAGERYIDCAARELEEELGIRVNTSDLVEIGRLAASEDNGFEFVRIYGVSSDQPIVLEADEIDDGKWLSGAELDEWVSANSEQFAETFTHIWNLSVEWRKGL